MKTTFLFTYGLLTNKSIMGSPVKYIGVGTLHNHKLEMFAHANVIESKNDSVRGIVWEIPVDQLKFYDMIEGYPTYYDRTLEWVSVNGEITKMYVYKMTDESRTQSYGLKPSTSYIKDMYNGYGNILPTGQIVKAMEDTCY